MSHTVDFQWILSTTCNTIYYIQGDLKQFLYICNNDAGFSRRLPAELVEDIDDVLAQEALRETCHGSSLFRIDRSVINHPDFTIGIKNCSRFVFLVQKPVTNSY